MTEDQKEENEDQEMENKQEEVDDLQAYMAEMKALESDFSDLEDLDMDELKEMQEAIAKVQEGIEPSPEELASEMISDDLETDNMETVDASEITLTDEEEYLAQKEAMITDFSDIDDLDFDELREMKEAIETVKQEEGSISPEVEGGIIQPQEPLSAELEERIRLELEKRKEEEEEAVVTPEQFLEYIKVKRDKIWYHSLWYIVFEVDDHIASKSLLYDVLKEVTSRSPIDPIQKHKFYFGLGYILRLSINKKQVIRFITGGKFKVNVNIDNLKQLLEEAGEPISTRPVLKEEEKQKMYSDFLKDDFLDI